MRARVPSRGGGPGQAAWFRYAALLNRRCLVARDRRYVVARDRRYVVARDRRYVVARDRRWLGAASYLMLLRLRLVQTQGPGRMEDGAAVDLPRVL